MAMFGSGAAIVMAITAVAAKQILRDLQQARTVFCVAAVGPPMPGTAGRRIAAATVPTTATTSAVFVWFLSHDLVVGYRVMPASYPREIRSKFHGANEF